MNFKRIVAVRRVAALLFGVAGVCAHAAPDEIQVYTEELDAPGESGVELHLNQVPSGRTKPTYPGESQSAHRLQVTPEFSYGLTRTLEAGLYLPVAVGPDTGLVDNGIRFRLKFIAPRPPTQKFFWGLNGELGWYARRTSESRRAMEFRPIIGWRDQGWLVSFNPILDVELSGGQSHKPSFDPALKIARAIRGDTMLGVEYYSEFGPLGDFHPARERPTYVYAVIDTAIAAGVDLNFGIGRGSRGAEDRWVLKAIVSMAFE